MSNTYTGADITWTGTSGDFNNDTWSPLPPGESYPGPLDNAILTGAAHVSIDGSVAIAGLDASATTGVANIFFVWDGAILDIGTTPGSTVGGEFDAGGLDSVEIGNATNLNVGPYVTAATGVVNISDAVYIWHGAGTAASVTQTIDLFDPSFNEGPGEFIAETQFYGSIGESQGALIFLSPSGSPTGGSATIVGDTIDYQTTDSQGAVSHYSLALTSSADPSALHISDWIPGTMYSLGGITVYYAVPNDFSFPVQLGTSDIPLVQASGEEGVWEMSGTSIVGGGDLGPAPAQWTPVATGDFYQLPLYPGVASFLLQDAAGDFAVTQPQDPDIANSGALEVIGNPGGTWALKGVGDFNGDGESDLLFQDASGAVGIWELDGWTIVGGGNVGNPGGTWQVKGVGDFNGDGKSGVLFQNASGEVAIWDMDGTSIVGGGDIGNPGGTWHVKGVGDFNGDGRDDILFENATGDYAIWEMNGTAIIGGGDIGNPGGAWQFAGVGDYTGGATSDILFEHTAGDLAIWEMNGTQIVGGGDIGNPGSPWHVLG